MSEAGGSALQTPLLCLTQGDPAGVGPEILVRLLTEWQPDDDWLPLLIAEEAALCPVASAGFERRLRRVDAAAEDFASSTRRIASDGTVPWIDPVGAEREVTPGRPGAADANGALQALDLGADLASRGVVDALVTAPLNKAEIARHVDPTFRGHTDHLAQRCGLEQYGRDYLMAFLAEDLQVALLSTHCPLREAIDRVQTEAIVDALRCMQRGGARRIALAGLNPHAGEGGLLGTEDDAILAPAVEAAREAGCEVSGPFSPDTVFHRCREGDFDWVLALYHDQGLIAIKTLSFGGAVNFTMGLPYLRTSPDHGTAYDIAGRAAADIAPMRNVIRRTVEMLRG